MIYGALRVKNEARWIERVISSIQGVCDRVTVLDDHSTDGTPDLCEAVGAEVHRSTFDGIDETRDKDYLLSLLWRRAKPGDWCFMIDGDEELAPGDEEKLIRLTDSSMSAWTQRILYLWNRLDLVRVDGVYATFRRASLFRLTPGQTFRRSGFGGNFHCASVPADLIGRWGDSDVRLLHYGYLHAEDRIRKYNWYNSVDPNNPVEDGYRHMVIGDLFPASSQFRWAGPLQLRHLEA